MSREGYAPEDICEALGRSELSIKSKRLALKRAVQGVNYRPKGKSFSSEEQTEIDAGLINGMSRGQIATKIGRSRCSVIGRVWRAKQRKKVDAGG
jgi:hypothetical protein